MLFVYTEYEIIGCTLFFFIFSVLFIIIFRKLSLIVTSLISSVSYLSFFSFMYSRDMDLSFLFKKVPRVHGYCVLTFFFSLHQTSMRYLFFSIGNDKNIIFGAYFKVLCLFSLFQCWEH